MKPNRRSPLLWAVLLPGSIAGPVLGQTLGLDERPTVLDHRQAASTAEEQKRAARIEYGLACRLHKLEQLIDAMKHYEAAARLDPTSPAPLQGLFPIYTLLDRGEDALETCLTILRLDPDDYETRFFYGLHLKQLGKTADAVCEFRRAAESRRSRNRPDRRVLIYRELAWLYESEKKHAELVECLREMIAVLQSRALAVLPESLFRTDEINTYLAQAWEQLGKACLTADRPTEAVDAFHEAQKLYADPLGANDPSAASRLHWHLAEVLTARNRLTEALAHLDPYLENSPPQMGAYRRKLDILRRLGRSSEVLPTIRRYAEREKHHLGLQLLLAEELAKNPAHADEAEAKYHDLREQFNAADVYRGLCSFYIAQQKQAKLLRFLDDLMRVAAPAEEGPTTETRTTAVERMRVLLAVLREDGGKIVPLLVDAALVSDQPLWFETCRILAVLAARHNRLSAAADLLEQALRTAPARVEAELCEGLLRIRAQRREWDKIRELCQAKQSKATGVERVVYSMYLAQALAEQNQAEAALAACEEALTAAPEAVKPTVRLRKLGILSTLDRCEQAVRECEKLLTQTQNPTQIRALRYTLAGIYAQMKEYEKSEEQLHKVLELDPMDAAANNNLGYQWADRNHNLDEAERLIRRALEVDSQQRREAGSLDGENAAYLDSLGWVLYRKGNYKEALKYLEAAAKHPDGATDGTVFDHLGDCYEKLGEPAQAKSAWETALKFAGDDRRSRQEGKPEEIKRKLDRLGTIRKPAELP